jgi:hypothetical protein
MKDLQVSAPALHEQLTKANVQKMAEALALPVKEGEISSVEQYAKLSYMRQVIDKALAAIEETTATDLFFFEKNKAGFGEVSLEFRQGARTYKYDHFAPYVEAKARVKDIEDKMKAAEKMTVVDEQTGEVVPAAKVEYKKDSIVTKIG